MKDERLTEMRVFQAVVHAGSFTGAAHALGVSQPFVSQSLHNLEQRLNVKLLHRSTRTQRLTGEGERFLISCKEIFHGIEEAEAEIRSGQLAGELRISAPRAFGLDQITPTFPAFVSQYPGVTIHFSLSDAMVNLIDDNFDVAIRMGELKDSSLRSRKLCNLQRIVVAAPAYVASHGVPVTPHGLKRHECLMWDGLHERLNQWPFQINGQLEKIPVQGRFRSSDGSTLFELCAAGVGVMRLAEHLAVPAIRSGRLVPLLSDYLANDGTAIHAVYLAERQLIPRVRAYIDHLVNAFHTPPWH